MKVINAAEISERREEYLARRKRNEEARNAAVWDYYEGKIWELIKSQFILKSSQTASLKLTGKDRIESKDEDQTPHSFTAEPYEKFEAIRLRLEALGYKTSPMKEREYSVGDFGDKGYDVVIGIVIHNPYLVK